ncbi:aspartate aminotransferase family protein [Brevibacillus marinus]|uniref:aspartate aminotransferase family protein n=1 Tax=Brevibacillus marinus TaxID=2496837 RepID=UPI000F825F61
MKLPLPDEVVCVDQQSYVIKPELGKTYPLVTHGKGVYLYDQSGNAYLDGCSGAVTAGIGHAVPEIAEAMYEQARKVSFAYRSHFTSEAAETLAGKLAEWAPGSLKYSFFVNSGSEATETAQKIAIQYWQERGYPRKNKMLSRWMSYHGITIGALSMSGHVLRRKRFVPLLADYPNVPAPYCYRCPYALSPDSCSSRCLDELETAIQRIGAENIAAFIAEPVIGAAGGAVVPPAGYYQRVREICDRNQILFIADEVMTGIGRTGRRFGIDHWGVAPDIMTLGKGLSAGYTPLAAALVSEEIVATIARGSGSIMAGHTYSANPQSSAIALAVLRYVEQHRLVENARLQGEYLLRQLKQLAADFSLVGDARGLGLLCALEFVRDKRTKAPFALSEGVGQRIIDRAFAKGLIIYPALGGIDGQAGDAVIIAPPLVISRDELDELIRLLREAIAEVQAELEGEGLVARAKE